ncbi:MAG: ABC transporter ATP-binding protein [Mariniblastus sp.]
MNPVIRFDNVTRTYGGKRALDNVSLEVPRGCVFALLGENGAGKTTAIKSMLGLDLGASGNVEVLGMNPRSQGIEVRRRVGFVPDVPSLYDWMTVKEAGWFTAGFYPLGFENNFNRLCSQYELDTKAKIKSLSKGGRAKVGLALAMAHQPELIIMDEPTSGLDTLVRRKFLESMVDVAAEQRTIFLSSHQISEVERVADQVAIIHQGRVLVNDRLENLKQRIEWWVVSFAENETKFPPFAGEVIFHEGRNRRQRLMIRDPGPDALWQLRDSPGIVDVEVHTPSLEEIFVAFLKSGSSTGPNHGSAHLADHRLHTNNSQAPIRNSNGGGV